MKMAKASQSEMDRAMKLVHLLGATIDTRPFDRPQFLDTDEEEGAPFDEDDLDDLKKLVAQIRELCPGLMRVVFGFHVLVDNCCDPTSGTLAWKPELAAALNLVPTPDTPPPAAVVEHQPKETL